MTVRPLYNTLQNDKKAILLLLVSSASGVFFVYAVIEGIL